MTYDVAVGAGTLRVENGSLRLPHAWTPEGVVARTAGTGAHLLHLSVAVCVLNDTYREAQRLGIAVAGVEVRADGEFDDDWTTTGVTYAVRVDTGAPADEVERLLRLVDEVAEIPRVLRAGGTVVREGA